MENKRGEDANAIVVIVVEHARVLFVVVCCDC